MSPACGSSDPRTDPANLQGVDWVLDQASAGSLVAHPPEGTRIDLHFQESQVSGSSGCNTYGGGYEADDGAISIGPLNGTLMACDPKVMGLESAYLAALDAVSGFQVGGTGLVLTGGDVALTFTAGGGSPSPAPE